jgi:hypothetical protein
MSKNEIELIEVNKEIAIAGNLEWSVVIESMILNTYREAIKQGKSEQLHNKCSVCNRTDEERLTITI